MTQTVEFISDLRELRSLYSQGDLRLTDFDQLIRKHQHQIQLGAAQFQHSSAELFTDARQLRQEA